MPLLQEREEWRLQMRMDVFNRDTLIYLTEYEKHRHSDLWRSTRALEKLCEYVLYLEERLDGNYKDL